MSRTVDRFVKQGFRSAAPYNAEHHDFAWQHRQLARLMSNECPLPPSPRVLGRGPGKRSRSADLYPNSGEERASRPPPPIFCGARPESVVLGNGSTEVLDVVVTRLLVGEGDETVVAVAHLRLLRDPDPAVRGHAGAGAAAATTWEPRHRRGPGGGHPPRTKIIFLCSPNNPYRQRLGDHGRAGGGSRPRACPSWSTRPTWSAGTPPRSHPRSPGTPTWS